MGDSQISPATTMSDGIRGIFSFLDKPAYWLLGIVYELFFNVASADLFANATVMKFFGRVQLILGVFMMFQLALTILKGIVNPDTITDSKSGNGIGGFIMRLAVALVMLTLLIPFETNRSNEYEAQISNNGLLFGTLYSLQHRLLANNTLGRLILGTDGTSDNYFSDTSADASEQLKTSARIFSSPILKGFYRINLLPEDSRPKHEDGKDDAVFNDNRVCQDIDDAMLAAYTRVDAYPEDIISMVNATCTGNSSGLSLLQKAVNLFDPKLAGNSYYVFAYNGFISMIVGFVFVVILLSFTIEVAVRGVKLAVLRLIAPIPIISYMDPKGSKDNAFNTWVKTLTSTYIDLFIRLSVVYFVIFLIQDMIVNGVVINNGTGVIGIISWIIIWLGLFIFAKQAPKFIRSIFGLKEEGPGLFSGLGEAMGAISLATGTIGSFNAARAASRAADVANRHNPNMPHNIAKHALSGIAGGIMGASEGYKAWQGAKGSSSQAVREALQKRNSSVMEKGLSGSFLGRTGANIARSFQGDGATRVDRDARQISQLKDIEKAGKDLFSYLEGKGKTDYSGETVTTAKFAVTANGVSLGERSFTGSLDDLLSAKQAAVAAQQNGSGDGTFTWDGVTFRTTDQALTKLEEELSYAAGFKWAYDEDAKGDKCDIGYAQKRETYNESVRGAASIDPNNAPELGQTFSTDGSPNTVNVSSLRKRFKKAGGMAVRRESDVTYKRRQNNYNAAKKK